MYLTTPQRYALVRQAWDVAGVGSSYASDIDTRAEGNRLYRLSVTMDWLAETLGPEPLALPWPLWWSEEAAGYTMTVSPESYARKAA